MSSLPGMTQGHLGRYELLARLATGGMGEIFLGRLEGAAGFEKLYVIKRVLPHLADDVRFRAMLIDEARIAAKMSHPNICQVYELGEDQGQLFIAMEYLEGVTLLPVLRRASRVKQPLAVGLVAAVLQQTADALQYAHDLVERDGTRLNVVHRDVTPSNLFLTETGIIKVLDFGIAKVKDASVLTQDGTVKGKYAYMAPEQLRSEEIDRRVDVFSLGIVGFEMLALRRLFQRKTDYLTFRAVMELPIPDLREFRPDLPPGVSEAFRRALERDPGNRFSTVRQFATALLDAIHGHAKLWTSSQIGDYIQENFAEELRRRGSAVSTVIRDSDTAIGSTTMPVVSIESSSPDNDADGDDDFPSVDTGLHAPIIPPRVDSEPSLTELAPAPRESPSQSRARQFQEPSVVAPAPSRRSVLWPLFAVAIVAGGAIALWFMWQQIKSEQKAGGIVIVDRGNVQPEGTASGAVIVAPGSGSGAASGSAATAPAGSGSALPGSGQPGGGTDKPDPDKPDPDKPPRRDKMPTTESEIKAQVKRRLAAKLGAINDCVNRHKDSVEGTPSGIVLAVKASSGKADARVEPAKVDQSPLGACIRKVAEAIDFGPIPADRTIHQELQQK